MGSAISSVMSPVSSIIGGAVSPVTGAAGSVAASSVAPIVQALSNLIPKVPVADQSALQGLINHQMGISNNAGNTGYAIQNQANQTLQGVQQGLGQAQGAINTAQNTNQGGNVANSLQLLQQQAQGVGPAAQQARAMLTEGANQSIAQQHALANSGNASQMISGQKTAMDNAARITQGTANQAAQLLAQQQGAAQQVYAGAAGQQASQAAQNAALQQQQTAQQAALYGTQANAGLGYNQLSGQEAGNALTGQTNAQQITQQTMNLTGQNVAQAAGGIMGSLGGAATTIGGVLSDENTKTDIQSATNSEDPNTLNKIGSALFKGFGSLLQGEGNAITKNTLQTQNVQGDSTSKSDNPNDPNAPPNLGSALFKGFGSLLKGGGDAVTKNTVQVPSFNLIPLASDKDLKDDINSARSDDAGSQIKRGFIKGSGYSDSIDNAGSEIKRGFLNGSGYTMSSEDTKKDIGADKNNKVAKFLDKLDAVTFKYKEPDGQMGKTPGTHIGVIAQQIEKAPLGKSLILDTPEGKAIDIPSAVGTLLAAATDANDRLRDLEEYLKSKRKVKK